MGVSAVTRRLAASGAAVVAVLGITLLGVAPAQAATNLATAASSEAPSAVASHTGTWRIDTPFNFTQSNAKFTTHATVSGCVNFLSGQGTLGWHFRLIWFDGGKNKVLWTSREFSNAGRHCSPVIKLHHHLPKVYSQEVLNCENPIPLPCLSNGTWLLKTN